MHKMFRPMHFNGKYRIKNNPVGQYHYFVRNSSNWTYIERTAGILHYRADHAPLPVQKKWRRVFKKFIKTHRKF